MASQSASRFSGQSNFNHNKILNSSVNIWFISLVFAQIFFVAYLVLGYGMSTMNLDISNWNTFNKSAYIEGDGAGNIMYGVHVLFAIIMLIGGNLQLIPQIRQRYTRFHRYNGRLFVCLACVVSIAGIYLILFRGTVGNAVLHGLTLFGGVVVLLSSLFAVWHARKRDFLRHQIWATRLFLAANGVLFFRLIMFAWLMLFGTVGIEMKTFTGPTVLTISIFSYVMPLVIYEIVRYAKTTQNEILKLVSSLGLLSISLVFITGLFSIAMSNWIPSVVASFG